MPCNTVTTNTVKLENVRNHDLLEAALTGAFPGGVVRKGSRFVFTASGREVTIDSGQAYSTLGTAALQAVVSQVKQAYARKAVELAARRFGWAAQFTANGTKFELKKG